MRSGFAWRFRLASASGQAPQRRERPVQAQLLFFLTRSGRSSTPTPRRATRRPPGKSLACCATTWSHATRRRYDGVVRVCHNIGVVLEQQLAFGETRAPYACGVRPSACRNLLAQRSALVIASRLALLCQE